MDKPTDMIEQDISRAMEDLYDDVLNYSEADEITRAPKLMRKHLKRIISRLEQQLQDWKDFPEL